MTKVGRQNDGFGFPLPQSLRVLQIAPPPGFINKLTKTLRVSPPPPLMEAIQCGTRLFRSGERVAAKDLLLSPGKERCKKMEIANGECEWHRLAVASATLAMIVKCGVVRGPLYRVFIFGVYCLHIPYIYRIYYYINSVEMTSLSCCQCNTCYDRM